MEKALTLDRLLFQACESSYCGCRQFGGMNIKDELRRSIEEFRNMQTRICLDCVKTRGIAKREGRCGVSHL